MRGWPEEDGRNDRTRDHATHQHIGRFSAGKVHEQHAQDRAQHGNSAEHKRVNHSRRVVRQRQCADKDRADQAHCIRFEHIGGHARAIAHVVADVVCDRCRVARIIFFETLLDLAHKVRSDVGRLGVDPAAESREHADETSPEGETNQTIDRHLRAEHTRDHECRKLIPTEARAPPRAAP